MTQPIPAKVKKPIELKVKAGALGSYVAAAAGMVILGSTVTDFIHSLPDVVETVLYPIVPAAASLLAGYLRSNKPDYLSQSTIDAASAWLRDHLPRRS